jgi:hypothetical protein
MFKMLELLKLFELIGFIILSFRTSERMREI